MGYRELMRLELLERMYEKMTDEEKRTFIQLTMQDKSHQEIMDELVKQRTQLERIERGQNWKVDFLSDVGANFLTDGLVWLGSKLLRRL